MAMMGLITDRATAALIAHRLASQGMSVEDLVTAITATLEVAVKPLAYGMVSIAAVLGVDARAEGFKPMVLRMPDGTILNMPRMTARLRLDEDGDIVLTMREILVEQGVRLRRQGIGKPVRMLVEQHAPETLTAAMAGRPLASIVAHPALDPLALVIAEATCRKVGWHEIQFDEINSNALELVLAPYGKTIIRR